MKKILVIQQKMIGDVLASTIICQRLKNIYPNCIIHFVANRNTIAVLENNPNIDKLIIFEQKYRTSKLEFHKFLKSFRKTKYLAAIDAYGKLESNLITLFTEAEIKISHPKWYTKWIYTHTVKENLDPSNDIPLAFQNRLNLINPISSKLASEVLFPKIYLRADEIEKAQASLTTISNGTRQQFIMISILGSGRNKTYPAQYMAEVLDLVCTNTEARLIFNYIPNQKDDVLEIYNKCNRETKSQIAIDFYAESLRDFLAVLSQCIMLIGNEGGAVNMAKALEIPTFCMFSPFILKGAWHNDNSQQHVGVHLKDYAPE